MTAPVRCEKNSAFSDLWLGVSAETESPRDGWVIVVAEA